MAGTGSERCRGEPTVSPHTRPAGGERTDCSGGKTTRPPTARPIIKENELVLHAKPRGVAVTDLSEILHFTYKRRYIEMNGKCEKIYIFLFHLSKKINTSGINHKMSTEK